MGNVMGTSRIGVIMNGVTGRMGMNQHLIRSVLAIRDQGGVTLRNGDRLVPDPILVGRNEDKIRRLAEAHGVPRRTTELEAALENPDQATFFAPAQTQPPSGTLPRAAPPGHHVDREGAGTVK